MSASRRVVLESQERIHTLRIAARPLLLIRYALLLVSVWGAALLAQARAERIHHPQPDLVIRGVKPAFSVALAGPSESQAFAGLLARAIRRAHLGGVGADVDHSFENIRQVAVDDDGAIYVLDTRLNDVSLSDSNGRVLQRLGPGRGIGAPFNSPISLARLSDRRIAIGDLSRRAFVYRRVADSLILERVLALTVAPQDMCVLKGELVVFGSDMKAKDMVHVFTRSGAKLRSFGSLYNTTNRILAYMLDRGAVHCDEATGLILVVPDAVIPDVRAYTSAGQAKWVTLLEGYRQGSVTESGDTVSSTVPRDGFHRFHSITPMPNGHVLLQLAHVVPVGDDTDRPPTSISSIELDPSSGKGLRLGRDLPSIKAMTPAHVVTVSRGSPVTVDLLAWPPAKKP